MQTRPPVISLAIETAEDGRHIGGLNLHNIVAEDRRATLGIMIGEKDCWSRGYGTDAILTLLRYGFARGSYGARADDGLALTDCRITNAVRCVPPANKPVGKEIASCRTFLAAEIAAMPRLEIVTALGLVAHNAVLAALGLRQSHAKFTHGAQHELPGGVTLADSYHCSRYNTNTGRLSEAMFHAVFEAAKALCRKA